MKRISTRFLWVFLLLAISFKARSQVYMQKLPKTTRILFLLDASGSMAEKWGQTTRIDVAKHFLSDFVDSLRINKDLQLALRVYGFQYPNRYHRCDDSKLLVPFGSDNHDEILQKIKQIQPKGVTPIAYSLLQAANDFPEDKDARNIVILITDGIESCNGDPCSVSTDLQKKGIFLRPFVIGIGMDMNYAKQFSCMGKFFNANQIGDFKNALKKAVTQTLEKTTVSVELLDENEQPTVSDINVSFINNLTGKTVYDFVHYLDQNGLPDTVDVDAVIPYDLRVNTVPPVYKYNLDIIPGKHNIIRVKAPQGSLLLSQKNSSEYSEQVNILVRLHNSNDIINVQSEGDTEKYLTGSYDLEVLTLPRIKYSDVVINAGKLTRIDVPPPGVLNILLDYPGYGSIYLENKDGSTSWIYDMNENITQASVAMQPGTYKFVFRAKSSMGSKYTYIKKFTIESGKTFNISL